MGAFGAAQAPGPFNPTERPLATPSNITAAVAELTQLGIADPFSNLLINGQSDIFDFYVRNPLSFQADVESLASSIWAQTINAFSRKGTSLPMRGTIEIAEPRLFLRRESLRVMQALLGCIGLISVFGLTFLRPKTLLRTDPGPLATAALMLSASDPWIEERLGSHAQSPAKTLEQAFLTSKWSLQSTLIRGQMEVKLEDLGGPEADKGRRSTGAEAWRPLTLRLSAKIALIIAMLVFMMTLGILQWVSSRNRGLCRYTFVSSTVASIAPATVLVLLGYWVSGFDRAARSLLPYKKLRKASSRQTLLLNIRDTVFFWSPTRRKTDQVLFTLVTSAVILLVVPVVKLIAAGLYGAQPSLSEDIVAFQADTSLPDTLASIWNVSDFDSIVKRASEFTEWTTIPGFNVPQQPGIINNLVLSNITSVVLSSTTTNQTDSELSVRVLAVAVDIKCTPLPSSDFNLSAEYYSTLNQEYYSSSASWTFTWYCKSATCSTLLNQTVQVHQAIVSKEQGLSPPYRYQGSSFVQNPYYDTKQSMGNSDLPPTVNTAFNVILADVSALIRPYDSIQNASLMELGDNSTSKTMWVGNDTFSFPPPTVRALSCARELSLVQVNATYARTSKVVVGDVEKILPWSPVSVDLSSVTHERAYPTMQPYWFAPVTQPTSQYTQSDDMDGKLTSDSLWPKIGSPTNFWELLAAYAEFKGDNLTSILDANKLAAATEAVLTAYCTQILTQLRPLALASAAPDSQVTQSLEGILSQLEPRLVQSLNATIALESLFALMLCCLVWLFIQFPSESILPKPPDSIAARFSLLANSSVVQRLRDAGGADLEAMGIWQQKAALGWWLHPSKSKTAGPDGAPHDESVQWRWGIDVGSEVILRSWNSPPTAAETAELLKFRSEPGVPYIPPTVGDSCPSLVGDGSRFDARAEEPELESLMDRDQKYLLDEHDVVRPTMRSPGLGRAPAI